MNQFILSFLNAGILALIFSGAAPAAAIYIGDDAGEGFAITSGGGTTADSVNTLTYAFTGIGSTFTSPSNQNYTLQEVNFVADEGGGTLTPFVARYNGGNNQLGASYTVLSIGDPLTVPAGAFGGGGLTVQNRTFTVGGVNPVLSLLAGDVLVAGLYQSSRIVALGGAGGSNNDYINNGSSLPGITPAILTSDSDFALNRTLRFNIGLTPEPSIGSLGLLGFSLLVMQRRRANAPSR